MRRHTRIILGIGWLVAGVGLAVAGDAAQEAAIRRDREKYQGVWQAVSLEGNGTRAAAQDAQQITVINHADGTWVVQAGGETF